MTTAAVTMLIYAMRKTAAWPRVQAAVDATKRGLTSNLAKDIALPAAVGAGSAGVTSLAGGDSFQTAASAVGGAGIVSRPMRHIFSGGTHGSALKELDNVLKNPTAGSKRWSPGASGELSARGTDVKVDPANPHSVAAGREDLQNAASKTRWGGGSLGVLGKAGLMTAATVPRLAGDAQTTLGNVAAGTAGLKEGEDNPNNVRTPAGGKVNKIFNDEKGRQVVQYTTPAGETQYHVAEGGMKLAPGLEAGTTLKPNQSVFMAGSIGSNLTRAAGNIGDASSAVKDTATNTAGISKDVKDLMDPAKKALGAIPEIASAATTAASGVAEAGKGVGALGNKAGELSDTLKGGIQDIKGSPVLKDTVQSVGGAAKAMNTGTDAVSKFLQSDQAKMIGGGVAAIGLAYLLHKMFSRSRDD